MQQKNFTLRPTAFKLTGSPAPVHHYYPSAKNAPSERNILAYDPLAIMSSPEGKKGINMEEEGFRVEDIKEPIPYDAFTDDEIAELAGRCPCALHNQEKFRLGETLRFTGLFTLILWILYKLFQLLCALL
uniref:Uncharacterized protein n=1 Tax=Anopheles minimus TaxID=112268 RepID=A0A182W5T8_9DIPT